jgi:uncharacterized protein YerC
MNPYMSKPKLDRKIEVPLELVKELLTPSELRMVKQRLLIINLLDQGLSVRAIADQAGVGTDTVVRISRKYESSALLKDFMKKPEATNSSTWVFGKNEEE